MHGDTVGRPIKPDAPYAISLKTMAVGLAAGVAGTVAMTASQAIEIRLTGRKPSTSPAEAVCMLLGIETRSGEQKTRLAREMHWAYGIALGLGQIVVGRLREPQRSLSYLAGIWSAGTVLVTATGVSPPPTRWGAKALLTDIMHHAVYAGVASLGAHLFARPRSSGGAAHADGGEAIR